jgi:hypothetical protein
MITKTISHNHKLIGLLGWSGVVLIIGAYGSLSFSLTSNASLKYQLANFFGALFLMISGYAKRDYEPVVLNVVWILVALIALIKIF